MKEKIAVVTGGSSGIGRCTAKALNDMGIKVYEFSRRDIPLENVTHITCDITDEKACRNAVTTVAEKEGKIDILINCAGAGISGAVEFTELSQAKMQFDINFFGMVNVTKEVIGVMRKNGGGRIVNISSVAAVTHIPFQAYYSASKAATESYSFALGNELKPFGITVTAIEPGDIATGFTGARNKSFAGDDIYMGRISESVSKMEKDEENGMSAEKAGEYIAKIALRNKVKPVYAIGMTYKFLCVLCKIFPAGVRNAIVGMLYAK